MSILFSPKIRLLLGVAAFSFVGIASSVYNNYSQAKQLEQKPQDDKSISLNQQVKPKKSQLSIDQSATHNTQISTKQTEIVSQNRNQQNSPNLITQLATTSITYPIIDEWRKYKFSVDGDQILSPSQLPTAKVNVNQADLLAVLVNTRQYFQEHASDDPDILRPGLLSTQKVTTEDILKTLDFMIAVLKEDIANNRITRLQNPNFINRNFRVIKWTAYNPENQVQKQLRITKYAVFTHPGSRKRTATFNTPIYSL
ncbi:hypothetical protein WDZ92_11260, partial [Nostoc sp. NIES-2111]